MSLDDKKRTLMDTLRKEGYIRTGKVESAMRHIPREEFVPPEERENAYSDEPLHIGQGQTISAPHMVAIMTELLEPRREDRVLEVGGGSGYQAAVLSRLVKEVFSVELEDSLVRKARKSLGKAGISNVTMIAGDGSRGLEEHAPFDKILVACGSDRIYHAWEEQLKEGGTLAVPINSGTRQELIMARKEEGKLNQERLMAVSFVPLRH